MGLADTQTIGRIVVHPTNPNIVYVAASGHEWTDNEMRGVFKTTDGGKTWTKVFYKSPRTGANDLVMDPRDPNVLYAAMWQRIRRKWSDPRVEPGYKEGGVFKTTDGGKTWTEVSQGLPAPEFRGRIGIDISRSNPDTLYALVDNYEIGRYAKPGQRDAYGRPMPEGAGFIKGADVYRTNDGGKTWTQTSRQDEAMINYLNDSQSGTYGWVFGQIRIDPTNAETHLHPRRAAQRIASTAARRSGDRRQSSATDGSNTGGVHGDHHGMWIDPKNTTIIYNANDGGFYQTADGGKSWIFAVVGRRARSSTTSSSTPARRSGRTDRFRITAAGAGGSTVSKGRGAVPAVAFEGAPGGEGSNHAVDPNNPNIVYSHGFYGNFSRTDLSVAGGGRGRGAAPARRRVRGATRRSSRRTTTNCARSGWRRSSSRRTTAASSTPAIRTSSDRRTVATPGKRSAPTSPTTTRRRWATTRRRSPTRRSSRWPSRRRRRTCSTSAPTTAASTRRSTAARNGRS